MLPLPACLQLGMGLLAHAFSVPLLDALLRFSVKLHSVLCPLMVQQGTRDSCAVLCTVLTAGKGAEEVEAWAREELTLLASVTLPYMLEKVSNDAAQRFFRHREEAQTALDADSAAHFRSAGYGALELKSMREDSRQMGLACRVGSQASHFPPL